MAWRKDPRPEDHRALHVPWVDWNIDYRDWKWHNNKFGYKQEEIFGSLHADYNCMAFAIQDPFAWHSDICELSIACKNREEFHAALGKRRDERFKEIRAAWVRTKTTLGANTHWWDSPDLDRTNRWGTFLDLARNFSFDCILAHFGNYLPANHRPAVSPSTTPQPLGQPDQPDRPDGPGPNSPPPPPASPPSSKKSRAKGTRDRASSRSAARSRVQKPPPKRRTSKTNASEGIRRSTRLQDALEGAHGSVRLQDGPEGEGIRRSARLQKRAARGA